MSTRTRKARDRLALEGQTEASAGSLQASNEQSASQARTGRWQLAGTDRDPLPLCTRGGNGVKGKGVKGKGEMVPKTPATASSSTVFFRAPGRQGSLRGPSLTVIDDKNPRASRAKSPSAPRQSAASKGSTATTNRKPPDANADNLDSKPTASADIAPTGEKKQQQPVHRKKPSWNALDRYYSKAHSFPDYGSSKDAMGVGFLKKLNQSNGPVNTLSTGSRRKFSDDHSPTNGTEAKRQKRETPQTSPFFAKPKLPKQATLDLTTDGSQDDVYDIRSVSSSGAPSKSAAVGVSEYRNAEPKGRTTPSRRRRSREVKNSPFRAGSSSSDIITSLKKPSESTSSTYQTIIDDSNDPAPASVVSDVTTDRRKNKGLVNAPQILRNEPQVKRQRPTTSKEPIDVSEDELQIAEVTPSGPVRRTNFSNITVSPRHKRLRGDIIPTDFSKAKNEREQSKSHLEVRKAVSGKCTYRANGSFRPPILLRQSPDNPLLLETMRNGKRDKQHPWLSIETKKVGKVHFHGRQILLHRSISPGTYPKLAIELATVEEADLLLSIIGGEAIECSSDHMDRMVEIAWKDAKKCQDGAKTNVLRQRDAARGEDIDEPEVNKGSREKHAASEPKGEKLKDKMKTGNAAAEEAAESYMGQDDGNSPDNQRRRSTRSSKKSSATRDPTDRDSYKWSEVNKEWERSWKQTLVYPATGRNRTSVEFDDISRLDNGEFVNDNVLSFYIRYVQDKMAQERPDLVSRVHIFSTFFYEKLNIEGGMNYAGVRSWTNKVDIFSYDYNIIPVNESNHWYLAIICHAPQLIEMTKRDATTINDEENEEGDNADNADPETRDKPRSPEMANVESQMSDISLSESLVTRRTTRQASSGLASSSPAPTRSREADTPDSPRRNKGRKTVSRKQDPGQPRILILDSFGATHDSTRRVLKDYLVEEALDKKKMNLTRLPAGAATVVPQQSNFCDCGVFAMGYVEQFLKNPDEASRLLILKQTTGWPIDPPKLRTKVRTLIFDLQNEQTERLAKEKEEKRRAAKERRAAARLKSADANSSESSGTDKAAKTEDAGESGSKNQSPEGTSTPTNDKPLRQTGTDNNNKAIKDDSGASVGSKSEEFYSAKSSPEQEQNQTRSSREKKPATPSRQSPVFVKPLPCSSDVEDDDKSNVDGTQDSIEIVEMKETPKPASSGRSQSKRRS